MALIEIFHVVATELAIDAVNATDIPQGRIVTLDTAGQVIPCNGTGSQWPVGIAGDSRSTGITGFTPESGSSMSRNPKTSMTGSLVTGAWGVQQRFTQNRVSDEGNEVLASGKMTVYHGGGEFWTDQYELVHTNGTTVATYTPGTRLYCGDNGETIGEGETVAVNGRFTDSASNNGTTGVVGITLNAPLSYPSGVPGTDTGFNALPEGGNSLTWGTFLHVGLRI